MPMGRTFCFQYHSNMYMYVHRSMQLIRNEPARTVLRTHFKFVLRTRNHRGQLIIMIQAKIIYQNCMVLGKEILHCTNTHSKSIWENDCSRHIQFMQVLNDVVMISLRFVSVSSLCVRNLKFKNFTLMCTFSLQPTQITIIIIVCEVLTNVHFPPVIRSTCSLCFVLACCYTK